VYPERSDNPIGDDEVFPRVADEHRGGTAVRWSALSAVVSYKRCLLKISLRTGQPQKKPSSNEY
jgi:hypothetical protein